MNSRERMLMYGVAAVAVLYAVYLGFSSYQKRLDRRRTEIAAAQKKANDLNADLVKTRSSINQLNQWRAQSLPSSNPKAPDAPVAREVSAQMYAAWLQKTLTEARINFQKVEPIPRTTVVLPPIASVGFTVSTNSVQLPNIIDFLYRFYNSGLLHQITRMDVSKDPTTQNLKLTINIEALILPGTPNEDKLPETKVHAFQLANMDAYKKLIEGRNIFMPFAASSNPIAPPEPVQVAEGTVDNSRFAKFTSSHLTKDGYLPWIYVVSTGEQKFPKVGETLTIDNWSTKIVGVEQRVLIVEDTATQIQTRVPLGEMIRDAQENRRGGGRGRGQGGRGRGGRGGDATGAAPTGATRGGAAVSAEVSAATAAGDAAAAAGRGRGGRGGRGGGGGFGGAGGGFGGGGFGGGGRGGIGGAPAEANTENSAAPATNAQPAADDNAAVSAEDAVETDDASL